ncbi:MAG: AMP-binding protein, partial [Frankia sp.]
MSDDQDEATTAQAGKPQSYASRPWLAWYGDGVPAEVEVPAVGLNTLLDDAAARWPTQIAATFLGLDMTYAQLRAETDALAGGLAKIGVKPGDRVAMILPNCPQTLMAFYAVLRLGAIVVEGNPLYTEHELAHQLVDSGAEVVICLDRTFATVAAARARGGTAVREVIVTSVVDYLPKRSQLALRLPIAKARKLRAELVHPVPADAGVLRFADVLASGRGTNVTQAPVDPTAVAVLLYTTGTTGAGKGAMLTHRNLVANVHQCRVWFTTAKEGEEVMMCVLPMFHAYGLTLCVTLGMVLGAHLILMPRFDVDMVFDAIAKYKPTIFPGVPPMYSALLASPRAAETDLTSINGCLSGSMKLPADLTDRWREATGDPIVEGYGMTESSPVTHAGPLTGPYRPGSIGLPFPSTECKVVSDHDPTVETPVGETGELAVRGPQVFVGYWNAPESTAEALTEDGWLLTGDIARMGEDGWFEIVDRKKELIIAGGFNIYPNDVEEVLAELTQIQDVAVIGVPDPYRGETVKAFIVVRPGQTLTEEEVAAHAKANLAAYKVPKRYEFRDELPKVGIGKVLRRALRAEEAE